MEHPTHHEPLLEKVSTLEKNSSKRKTPPQEGLSQETFSQGDLPQGDLLKRDLPQESLPQKSSSQEGVAQGVSVQENIAQGNVARGNVAREKNFFSNKTSVTGKIWELPNIHMRDILYLTQQEDLPEYVARLLLQRGLSEHEEIKNFLTPTIKETLPSPFHLHDMEKAAKRIIQAYENKEKVAIFGDYDVDGATSSALLRRFFKAIGLAHTCYIPDRMKEGYGPNKEAFQQLRDDNCHVIITVDCGTTSFDVIDFIQKQDVDVIVIDHHQASPTLPNAYAIINPNRIDQESNCQHMAAVGVTFLFVIACHKYLKEKGFYKDKAEPNLLAWLDLVALGTVCDVMPLTAINRTFVKQGLKVIQQRKNPGIKCLYDLAQISEAPKASHLGFQIGPRINAGGRIGKSSLGSDLLTTEDDRQALQIAEELSFLNEERKLMETTALQFALEKIVSKNLENDVVFVSHDAFHAGIIGILASRLKENFSKPSFVVHYEEEMGKGSARSVPGFDIGATIMKATQKGLLISGGGHKMAAGFTLDKAKEKEFTTFLNQQYQTFLEKNTHVPTLKLSYALSPMGVTEELVKKIHEFEPFGVGNEEPRIALKDISVSYLQILKEKHLKVTIHHSSGHRLTGMLFSGVGTTLGDALEQIYKHKALCHIAGRAKINTWMGKNEINFFIEDIIKT